MSKDVRVITEGRFLEFVCRDGWEFVRRRKVTGIVVVVPVTADGKLVFVEQYRPPVDRRVIEFPAGLAGDDAGGEDETLEIAARRELLEETGYVAKQLIRQFHGPPSAGATNEEITFYFAPDVEKVEEGGGDHAEDIVVHVVSPAEASDWLSQQERVGKMIDLKVYAGLYVFETNRPK